jgi:hypothetical protein
MSKKIIKYKIDVVEIQVRRERDGFEQENDCKFRYEKKGIIILDWRQHFSYIQ